MIKHLVDTIVHASEVQELVVTVEMRGGRTYANGKYLELAHIREGEKLLFSLKQTSGSTFAYKATLESGDPAPVVPMLRKHKPSPVRSRDIPARADQPITTWMVDQAGFHNSTDGE